MKKNENRSKIVLMRCGALFFVGGINAHFLRETLCNAIKKGQNAPFKVVCAKIRMADCQMSPYHQVHTGIF
jgi:hypothetical protein